MNNEKILPPEQYDQIDPLTDEIPGPDPRKIAIAAIATLFTPDHLSEVRSLRKKESQEKKKRHCKEYTLSNS